MKNILTLDFETFYSTEYSLTRLTTEAYVRDPRFRAHMVGLQMNDNDPIVIPHERIADVFARIPWGDTVVLAQHAHFDGLILSHHYNVRPLFWVDTLSMFRAVYPAESAALANQCRVLGLPPKGHELINSKGKTHLTAEEYQELARYCTKDVTLTRRIFNVLRSYFPLAELRLIDLTVRLFTEPILLFNRRILEDALTEDKHRLVELLTRVFPDKAGQVWAAILHGDKAALEVIKKPLASNPQFAEILLGLGIDPPKKLSPAAVKRGEADPEYDNEPPTGLIPKGEKIWTYAFGKTDEGFKHLLNSEDTSVAALVEARLGVKSTMTQTRTQRFIDISTRGAWPVYLKYAAAHTLRWGGGDRANPQNMTRGSTLRHSVEAPAGHLLVVRDLSAIEARVNAWLSGQEDMVEVFRRGEDVYCDMASTVFGRTITKDMKDQRFVGKTIVLGCGYGLGWRKFQQMIRVGMLGDSGRIFGADIADALGVSVDAFMYRNAAYVRESLPPNTSEATHALHCACAQAIIKTFRDNRPMIPAFWERCNEALGYILLGEEWQVDTKGVVRTCPEGFMLPSGLPIRYAELQCKTVGRKREYSILKDARKGERGKVYGGLCVENLVQRLARDIIAKNMLDIGLRYRIVMTTHDEIVCCVPEREAQECYTYMGAMMATPPTWAPDIPLASEGGFARNYSK